MKKYNAIDDTDYDAQYVQLKAMLGSVGEKVWIGKTFSCDNGKKIHIGNNFTGNFNLTILDIREVYIGDNVMIGPNTLITTCLLYTSGTCQAHLRQRYLGKR